MFRYFLKRWHENQTTCLQHCKQIDLYNLLVTLHAGWLHNCRQIDYTSCLQLFNNLLATLQTDQFTLIKQLACNIACRLFHFDQTTCLQLLDILSASKNIFFKVILFFIFPKKPSKNFSTSQSKMFRYFSKRWYENYVYFDILLATCMKVYRICIKHNISANE